MESVNYIERSISQSIKEACEFYPVILVTGPRQSGKSTLCSHLFPEYNMANLEHPDKRMLAKNDIRGFMESLGEKAIIDEVQNVPDVLSAIQVAVDSDSRRKYVITGSCNFALMKTIGQSLAGRVAIFNLLPLSLKELPKENISAQANRIMFDGFYPKVIARGMNPSQYYGFYYETYVERDIRNLFNVRQIDKFDIAVRLLAGRAASEFNASSLAVETGVTSPTISEWVNMLEASYIVFRLQPYYTNISKRLTKTPKIYFYDTGVMCYLLGIENATQLLTHPLRGAIFENMVVAELVKRRFNEGKRSNLSFYRENSGKEVDVVSGQGYDLDLFEIKASMSFHPDFLKNMNYLSSQIKGVRSATLVYDGESMPPKILNFRDL